MGMNNQSNALIQRMTRCGILILVSLTLAQAASLTLAQAACDDVLKGHDWSVMGLETNKQIRETCNWTVSQFLAKLKAILHKVTRTNEEWLALPKTYWRVEREYQYRMAKPYTQESVYKFEPVISRKGIHGYEMLEFTRKMPADFQRNAEGVAEPITTATTGKKIWKKGTFADNTGIYHIKSMKWLTHEEYILKVSSLAELKNIRSGIKEILKPRKKGVKKLSDAERVERETQLSEVELKIKELEAAEPKTSADVVQPPFGSKADSSVYVRTADRSKCPDPVELVRVGADEAAQMNNLPYKQKHNLASHPAKSQDSRKQPMRRQKSTGSESQPGNPSRRLIERCISMP